jgi:hypothetical protein
VSQRATVLLVELVPPCESDLVFENVYSLLKHVLSADAGMPVDKTVKPLPSSARLALAPSSRATLQCLGDGYEFVFDVVKHA